MSARARRRTGLWSAFRARARRGLPILGVILACGLLEGFGFRDFEARPEKMVAQSVPTAPASHDPVAVTVQGGQKAGWTTADVITNDDFAKALTQSLQRMGLFRPLAAPGDAAYRLDITLEDLDVSLVHFLYKADLKADWRLVDLRTRRVVWHDKIETSDQVQFFVLQPGWQQMELHTVENVGRKNIEQGLAKMNDAAFPASPAPAAASTPAG
jgi:hypothetical protein